MNRILSFQIFAFCYRESDRNKAIKLLLKIYKNIINNPSQLQKYGDLHFGKISTKLSKCKPALDLLISSGFQKSNDNTRLIWTYINNDGSNTILLNHVQNELKAMIANADNSNNNIDSNESKHAERVDIQQPQKVCYKIQHKFF